MSTYTIHSVTVAVPRQGLAGGLQVVEDKDSVSVLPANSVSSICT